MKIDLGPNAGAAGSMFGMLLAATVTVLSVLAIVPLIFGALLMLMIIFAFDAAAEWSAWLMTTWFVVALFLACWNMVQGMKAMNDPSWSRLGWLYGASAAMVVLGVVVGRLTFPEAGF